MPMPGSFPGVVETRGHGKIAPTTPMAVVTEPFGDWASLFAEPTLDIIYWYFTQGPNVSGEVGVAAGEKLAAAAHGAH